MGTRSYKACTLGGVLCAVAWSGATSSAARAEGYLSRTGPVPLRFTVQKPTATPCELPPLTMADPVPAPATQSMAALPPVVPQAGIEETNAAVATALGPVASPPEDAVAGFDANPLAIPLPQAVAPDSPEVATNPSASDLLVVTPQMLTEYFRPGRPVTNSANMAVYVPVEFLPPASLGGSPPSSRATYRTQ